MSDWIEMKMRLRPWTHDRLKERAKAEDLPVTVVVRQILDAATVQKPATPPAGPSNPNEHGKL